MSKQNIELSFDDILKGICELACSQGFYGRLYRDIMLLKDVDVDEYNRYKEYVESQHFSTFVDFIIWIES